MLICIFSLAHNASAISLPPALRSAHPRMLITAPLKATWAAMAVDAKKTSRGMLGQWYSQILLKGGSQYEWDHGEYHVSA